MPQYDLTINVVGKDKSSGIFAKLSGGLSRILQIAGGMVAARVFMKIADQLGSVVVAAINATAQFQNMEIGLQGLVARELSRLTDGAQTIADVFPQAEIAAAGLMDQLSEIAIVSPYMVEAVMNTFRMQMAFGFTTDQAMKLTNGLLNMAAGIGATGPMLQRMAYNLAQINLQGKVTKLDMRQLALAGLGLMDVLKYVSKEMGYNIETHLEFNDLIAEGAITWADFATLFEKYALENFAGASERMARTLYGLKSTFNDVFVLTMPKVIGPAVEVVTSALNKILDIFIFLRESGLLEEWGAVLGDAMEKLIGPIDAFLVHILKYLEIWSLIRGGSIESSKNIWGLRKELEKLAPSGDIIYDALSQTFGPEAAEWYVTIRRGVEKLIEVFLWFRTVSARVWESVGILFGGLVKFWDRYGTRISESIGDVVNALFGLTDEGIQSGLASVEGFAERIAKWLGGEGGEKITKGIETFSTWIIEEGIPAAREFVSWLEEKLPASMETLSNFYYETLKPAWKDFGDTWREDIMPGFENLKAFWDENGEAILQVLGDFALGLLGIVNTNAAEGISGLGGAFREGTEDLLENGPDVVENLKNITEKISNLLDTLTSPEFISGATNWAKFIGTLWIASTIIGSLSALVGIFRWLGPLLIGVGTGGGALATWVVKVARWAPLAAAGTGALAAALPLVLVSVIALGIMLQPEFDKITQQFTDWYSGILEETLTWAAEMPVAWDDGVESEREALMESLQGFADAALEIWQTTLSGIVMYAIGQDSMQGFWDGLKAKWAELWDWTVQVLADWWALMAALTFSRSPSTKAKELGANIMEGFRLGMESGLPKINELMGAFEVTGTLSKPMVYETITIPVTIGSVSSDVDIEELWIRLAERQRYERAMRRR